MQATSEKPYKKSGLISGLKNSSVFSAVMQGKISELEVALLADKKANDSLEKYITVDKEATASWRAYAESETCVTVKDVFLRLSELNDIWYKALQDLIEQRIQYCKVFKEVIAGEKKVEETRKEVDVHIDKIASLQKRKAGPKVEEKHFNNLSTDLAKAQEDLVTKKAGLVTVTENHQRFKHKRVLNATSVLMTCMSDALKVGNDIVEAGQKLLLFYTDLNYSQLDAAKLNKANMSAQKIVNDLRRKHGLSNLVIPADGVHFTATTVHGETGGHEMTYSEMYMGIPDMIDAVASARRGSELPTASGSVGLPITPGKVSRVSSAPGFPTSFATNASFPTSSTAVATSSPYFHPIEPSAPEYESGSTVAILGTGAASHAMSAQRSHLLPRPQSQSNTSTSQHQTPRERSMPPPLPSQDSRASFVTLLAQQTVSQAGNAKSYPVCRQDSNSYLALLPDQAARIVSTYQVTTENVYDETPDDAALFTRNNSMYHSESNGENVHATIEDIRLTNQKPSITTAQHNNSGEESSDSEWEMSDEEDNVYANTAEDQHADNSQHVSHLGNRQQADSAAPALPPRPVKDSPFIPTLQSSKRINMAGNVPVYPRLPSTTLYTPPIEQPPPLPPRRP